MKIINCPGCGHENRNRHYCLSCGCYLPPILEEELKENFFGLTAQPTYTTVQAQPTYTYITYSERDIYGRIKAPGGY